MKSTVILLLIVFIVGLMSATSAQDYVIKPGDSLGVTVLDEPELTRHVRVNPQGSISLPLIKEMKIEGLTLSQAADAVTEKLKAFIKNPQVSIELIEAARMQITVSGEVRTPGVFPVSGTVRLMDAITLAGGYTQLADLSKVSVTRPDGVSSTIDLEKFLHNADTSMNVPIDPGDTVIIPALQNNIIGTVSVLGAVRQPGQHQIMDGMTIREAIMLAGGPTEFADVSNVNLRRAGEPTGEVRIDYAAAVSGNPAANPALKPGDVIYIGLLEILGSYTIQGGVAQPGKYELKDKTSITEAIAIAGGTKGKVKLDKVRILRNADETSQTINANVSDIMTGKSPNMLVQNGDNIYVPEGRDRPDYLRILSLVISLGWLLTTN